MGVGVSDVSCAKRGPSKEKTKEYKSNRILLRNASQNALTRHAPRPLRAHVTKLLTRSPPAGAPPFDRRHRALAAHGWRTL